MTPGRLTIIVSGMIAATPYQGGATWAVLQYLLGFRRLGHDVIFIEPLAPDGVVPSGAPLSASHNAAYLHDVMAEVDMQDRWSAFLADGSQCVGMPIEQLRRLVRQADAFVNLAGTGAAGLPLEQVPVRVYFDLDPVFTQFWASEIDMRFAGHTHFVTVGQALGSPACSVPTCGYPWIATLQPVVLDAWPEAGDVTIDALTTVANWRSYGSIERDGQFYGQKAHSLRRFMCLPQLTPEDFALALSIHPDETDDLAALREAGWRLLDANVVAATPATYRYFIQGSLAEFGIAKHGYVAARSGWFSDRSACYLASGRPVLAQETGFSDFLPTGDGLFAFESVDGVLLALEQLRGDYPSQRRAARMIAVEHFDSDKVLRRLLRSIGLSG